VSDIDPADAISGRRSLPEAFTPELVENAVAPRKGEREGLPPGYRMRADSHYVDQLTSRKNHGDSSRSAGRDSDVAEGESAGDARERRDPRERRGDRALAQLTEDLATIESAVGLLGDETSTLGRRVSLDLIKAHLWRASWLLKAQALVDNPQRSHFRARSLPTLLGRLRDGLEPECRLNSHTLDLQVVGTLAATRATTHGQEAAAQGEATHSAQRTGQVQIQVHERFFV